jgi:hypothetical protein
MKLQLTPALLLGLISLDQALARPGVQVSGAMMTLVIGFNVFHPTSPLPYHGSSDPPFRYSPIPPFCLLPFCHSVILPFPHSSLPYPPKPTVASRPLRGTFLRYYPPLVPTAFYCVHPQSSASIPDFTSTSHHPLLSSQLQLAGSPLLSLAPAPVLPA